MLITPTLTFLASSPTKKPKNTTNKIKAFLHKSINKNKPISNQGTKMHPGSGCSATLQLFVEGTELQKQNKTINKTS